MVYNAGKKILHHCMSGKKKPITRGLRKSSYPNKITHTALKSQMVGPLLTCIFDSKEMTLIDILILSP